MHSYKLEKDKREFDRLIQEKYGQKELPFPVVDQSSKEQVLVKPKQLSTFNKSLKKALGFNPKEKKK